MHAIECIDKIQERMAASSQIVVFLDYDGTLTPIVGHPDLAVLTEEQRYRLKLLARKYPVAIISGRDREDVKRLIGLSDVYYAGSHGFDLSGPGLKQEMGQEYLSDLDRAERALHQRLSGISSLLIERKKYAIAIHYRRVVQERVAQVKEVVYQVGQEHADLRITEGKKIFEMQPKVDWHKGRALFYLLESMHLNRADVLPLFIGDDTTDEDAFIALGVRGITIAVQEQPRHTAAQYTLKNPAEVYHFLEKILSQDP